MIYALRFLSTYKVKRGFFIYNNYITSGIIILPKKKGLNQHGSKPSYKFNNFYFPSYAFL